MKAPTLKCQYCSEKFGNTFGKEYDLHLEECEVFKRLG